VKNNLSKKGETDFALATKKANAKGETKGAMRKPMAQILS
jgi:hypothetical protein